MKKILLASTVVLSAAVLGGGWYIVEHRDPLQQAKVLLAKGDYRSAGLQLRTAVRDNPSNAEAHSLLAQLYIASDDAVAAEHEIRQAMDLKWNQASSMAVLSQALMRQSKWTEILQQVPEKGSTPEQTAYYLMTRAVAQRGLKDNNTSTATLAEAERLAPQNAEVHLVASRFAQQDGHLDLALDEVNRSLAIEPTRTDALQFKSNLLLAKGDRASALAELNRAIDGAPARLDLLVERGAMLLALNEDAKAKSDIAAVLARDPKNVPARFVNAVLLIRESKFAEADTELQRIDPLIDRFQRGLYFKAMVKARLGQNAQAEDTIMTYMSRTPNDQDGVRLLAQIELATQHPARAIPYLLTAIQNGQRDPETLDLLGRAYAMSGNARDAETTFQQASKVAQSPTEFTRLASARLQVGDLSGAASDLQRSLEIAPTQPGAGEALVATALRLGQLDRAQQALDQLRQQTGETEAVGNLSGLLRLARLDPEGALTAFSNTSNRFPDAIGPKLNQAKVLLQLNRPDEAQKILQSILAKTPTQSDALTVYAQLLIQQGRGPEAIDAAERARKADPTNLGLINGEAQLYARMQQYAKALEVIETATVEGKTPVALLPTLGSIQLAAGQDEAAKRTFSDLVTADPNNISAVLSDVDLLIRLKDFDGARQTLDAAMQRQPANLPLLQARVRVELIDKGLDAGLETADRLRANSAYMPAAATLKGGVYMGSQRFKDAVTAFKDEYQKSPSSILVVALAQALTAAGDPNGATAELLKWQSSHPDDPAVAQLLGTLDITAHRYESSEKNLQIALKAQPTDLVALNNLAWIYQQKGDRRAQEYAQRAFEQAPTPEVTDTLAWILAQQGEAQKALPLLQSAASARPQNSSIRYHLAVVLKDTGHQAEAAEILRALLASDQVFDERASAQTMLTDLTKPKP